MAALKFISKMFPKKLLALLLFTIIAGTSFGQGFLKADGKFIVDENGNEFILRGMGLGGWMLMEGYMMQSSDVADTQHEFKERLVELMGVEKTEAFFDAWLANHCTKADIDSLAAWGFNSVRLPMHYNLFTLPIEDEPVQGEQTWLEKGFAMTDSLLSWCASNNIYLILDLHAAPGGQGYNAAICDYDPDKPSLWESEDNRIKTVALWGKLAERYSDEPWIGGYDLINEVNWDLPGGVLLRELYEDITEAIRAVDTNHIIFIEGNWFANDFTGLTPPWDDNMSYSFHKYWNYNDNPGSIQWVLDMREQHNVPLWMGESGENSNVWFTDAIHLFEDNNIGWSWWPMKRIETIVGHYSIPFTDGYKNVLSYWRGEAPQPTVDEAYAAMMELALNTNSANCSYHKDVHDAQIRQPHTDELIPFNTHTLPGIVYLSDYDLGKIGHAYWDRDYANYGASTGSFQAWNSGWVYRNDGVDIEANDDPTNSNGFHIGFVAKGEWMKYTIQVEEPGAYTAVARVASEQSGGKFHLELNDEDITSEQTVSATGGWLNFQDKEITEVLLNEGAHFLSFHIDDDASFNISSIEFIKTGEIEDITFYSLNGETGEDEKSVRLFVNHPINPESVNEAESEFQVKVNNEVRSIVSLSMHESQNRTLVLELDHPVLYTDVISVSYTGTAITSATGKILEQFTELQIRNTLPRRFALPATIQAEDWDYQEGLSLEETSDTGGGYNFGYTDTGDFADYRIAINEADEFNLTVRVASTNSNGVLRFVLIDDFYQVQDDLVIAELNIPGTGGWQSWTSISAEVSLPKGFYKLRLYIVSPEFNVNWFKLESKTGIEGAFQGVNTMPLIYPNPVSGDDLFIRFKQQPQDAFRLDFYNVLGNLISATYYDSSDGTVNVDISNIPKGVVILRIHTTKGVYTQKLFVN
jgi:endoglucanase